MEKEFPELWGRLLNAPEGSELRMLDIGCATGIATCEWKRSLPHVEVNGVDVGAGMLRWAHVRAERERLAINYSQQDARSMSHFPDQSVDLVISHIVFHEIAPEEIAAVLAECQRVLRPGGAMLHLDNSTHDWFNTEPHEQFRQHWQTFFQGEPFWSSWSSSHIEEVARAGGVELDIYKQVPHLSGRGHWYLFGSKAPCDKKKRKRDDAEKDAEEETKGNCHASTMVQLHALMK